MVYSPQNYMTFPFDTNFPMVPPINYVTAITKSNPAIVTTQTPHGYTSGLTVRIVFPHTVNPIFGMTQIDDEVGEIVVLTGTTFSVSIDSSDYDPFTFVSVPQIPQVVPIAVAAATTADDSTQINPVNPHTLAEVVIFQPKSPQAKGPVTVGG